MTEPSCLDPRDYSDPHHPGPDYGEWTAADERDYLASKAAADNDPGDYRW